MRRVVIIACLWLTLCTLGGAAHATPYVMFFEDAGFTDVYLDGTGLVNVYVVVRGYPSTTAVQFWAPIPDCWPATFLAESCPFISIGNSQTGLSIAYGACLSEPVHVLTISLWVTGPPPPGICCQLECLPDPQAPSGHVEFVDCNATKVIGYNTAAMISEPGAVPPTVGSPSPPDGATDQELNAQLAWESWSCTNYPRTHNVYFGTAASPPVVAYDHYENTYDPGPLTPNTTYFWKIVVWHLGPGGTVESPVWSFTTEDAVPTQESTWGAVKALYR